MAKHKIKTEIKKFEIAKRTDLNPDNLLPVIQNLTALGFTIADVGIMLGYCGKDPEGWFYRLKEKYPDINKALEIGKNLGDIELIKTAMQESLGYWIEEDEILSENVFEIPVVGLGEKCKPMKDKWVKKEKKTKRKFIQPNTQLLFKLLCCRLPEFFSDVKKIEVDKRSISLKGNIEEEIKQFAGALLHNIAEPIEAEFEPTNVRDTGTVLPTDSNESTGKYTVSDRPS